MRYISAIVAISVKIDGMTVNGPRPDPLNPKNWENKGFEVRLCANNAAAIAMRPREKFDLILEYIAE